MNNFERITASLEALGDFLGALPILSGPWTTISTGYFVTAATRRTATLKTAPTKLNGVALPGG